MAQVPVVPPPPSSPEPPRPKPQQTKEVVQMHVHSDGAPGPSVAEARSHLRRVNREIEVFRELRRRVLTGVYRPGERLPSMAALGEEFVVTESIVQKAVARLRELGLLRTDPGRGTWVVDAITDRATMRTVLDAARGGVFLDAMWGPDAGEIVEFPAAWIARLLDESDAPERLT